jgi:hypothetical protein
MDTSIATLVEILVGAALLLFGRTVLWLVLAGIGFIGGMKLSHAMFGPESASTTNLVLSIALGVLTGFLAIFIQKVGVGVVGFAAGGLLGYIVGDMIGVEGIPWIPILIGGVIGAVAASYLFKWAVSIISALVGAYLIVFALQLAPPLREIVFVLLTAVGMMVQFKFLKKRKADEK